MDTSDPMSRISRRMLKQKKITRSFICSLLAFAKVVLVVSVLFEDARGKISTTTALESLSSATVQKSKYDNIKLKKTNTKCVTDLDYLFELILTTFDYSYS